MRVSILLILALVTCGSCTVSSKILTVKVGEEPEEFSQQVIYSLPQTLFKVNIQLEKKVAIPGPYYLYAEHFLGLKDVISEPGISYRIKNVSVESFSEPDPEQFYSINTIKGDFNASGILELSKQGYILDPNYFIKQKYGVFKSEMDNEEFISLNRLVISENLKTVTDTLYKTIITDSSFIQIPVLLSQTEAKTLEQKAKEAADLIINIRNEKFYMLTETIDYVPDGESLEIAVKELEKMESDYIQAFTGRILKEFMTYSFIVSPDTENVIEQYPLAFFSTSTGVSEDEDNGLPLFFKFSPQNKVKMINEMNTSLEKKEDVNQVYYRIPDVAEISVLLGNYELYKSRTSVWQAGAIVSVPVSVK
jgi:hypothetical protein